MFKKICINSLHKCTEFEYLFNRWYLYFKINRKYNLNEIYNLNVYVLVKNVYLFVDIVSEHLLVTVYLCL